MIGFTFADKKNDMKEKYSVYKNDRWEKDYYDKLTRYSQKHPTLSFIFLGALLVTSLLIYNFYHGMTIRGLLKDITVPVTTMFLVGLFVVGYIELSKRKKHIERLQGEISAYKSSQTPEVTPKIVALINTLNLFLVSQIRLGGCFLSGADLMYADLERASLLQTNLRGANLTEANLKGASLWGADLEGANLTEANLEGAHLSDANLKGANLTKANLEGAYLSHTNLKGVNLTKANLEGANLTKANLEGVNFLEANLKGALVDDENWIEKLKNWKCKEIELIEKDYYVKRSKKEVMFRFKIEKRIG